MSAPYERTYESTHALMGVDKNTVIYRLALTPTGASGSSSSGSLFYYHFLSALRVEIVSCIGTLVVPATASTNAPTVGAINFATAGTTIDGVHTLARGNPISSSGIPVSVGIDSAVGVRRVIKGNVIDEGSPPALFVALRCDWDGASAVCGYVSIKITARFTGESLDVFYNQPFPPFT